MPLAAIACHFNPANFAKPRENFLRFRDAFRGCPLFTLEVSFDGVFHLDTTWRIEANECQRVWQKERLINLMVERLPAEFDAVAWIDADLLFDNSNWASIAAERLATDCVVLQLFSDIEYLDADGKAFNTHPSAMARLETWNASQAAPWGAPGGALAARREFFQRFGLYDANVTGGGDALLMDALAPHGPKRTLSWPHKLQRYAAPWKAAVTEYAAARVGYVDGTVKHFFHGTWNNRKYQQRLVLLNQFDPAADICVGDNGLLEWATDKPRLHDGVANYFRDRKEDEVPVKKPAFARWLQLPHKLRMLGCPEIHPRIIVNAEGIPEALRASARWVNWEWKWLGTLWGKSPIDRRNAPLTFDAAMERHHEHRWGISYLPEGSIACFDLDGIRDPNTGELTDLAAELVAMVDSYTEVSVSGTGLHILADLSPLSPKQLLRRFWRLQAGGLIDLMLTGRPVTFSGNHLEGTPATLEPRLPQFKRVCREFSMFNHAKWRAA